jgi:Protein of unknown function (DUF3194)
VKFVEELGIPELTTEQIEMLCSAAENAARQYITSKVPLRMVEKMDISVEAEGTRPVNLTVEIELVLSSRVSDSNPEALSAKAVEEALEASEKYLRKLK